ncbi:MAG: hypothetical protein AAF694_01550 [Bacteroidota bacterium]
MNFIKQEISQINYLRDREDAHVHIMVRSQRTGSGGQSVSMEFLGKNEFDAQNNSIEYAVPPQSSRHDARKLFVKHLQLGLIAYWVHTQTKEDISLVLLEPNAVSEEKSEERVNKDPWNNWVFQMSGGGSLDNESRRSSINYSMNVTANHVTPNLRVRTRGYLNTNLQVFFNEDEDIRSERKRKGFSGSIVKSLNNHWSYGFFGGIYSSTYSNIQSSLYLSPALEFNLFPYDEVQKREFTFAYKLGPSFRNYFEETLYERLQENLFRQSLELALRLNQPWGAVWVGLEGSHYFHDIQKNRLEFNSRLDFRLVKGLALNVRSNVEFIRDQLSLPKGEISLEDVLLQQSQQATNFESFVALGVSYTFGSIYNNIVNTRL